MNDFDQEFSNFNIDKIERARCGRCGKIRNLVWRLGKEWYGYFKQEDICNPCYIEFKKIRQEQENKKALRVYKFNCKTHDFKTDSESEYEFHINNIHKEFFTRK